VAVTVHSVACRHHDPKVSPGPGRMGRRPGFTRDAPSNASPHAPPSPSPVTLDTTCTRWDHFRLDPTSTLGDGSSPASRSRETTREADRSSRAHQLTSGRRSDPGEGGGRNRESHSLTSQCPNAPSRALRRRHAWLYVERRDLPAG